MMIYDLRTCVRVWRKVAEGDFLLQSWPLLLEKHNFSPDEGTAAG